jgi:hypothetical protein
MQRAIGSCAKWVLKEPKVVVAGLKKAVAAKLSISSQINAASDH